MRYPLKISDITLKRGLSPDLSLYQLRRLAEEGQVNQVRSTCIISLSDRNMAEIARFELVNAWPAAYEIVPTGDIPVEQVTLTHEGLKRTK